MFYRVVYVLYVYLYFIHRIFLNKIFFHPPRIHVPSLERAVIPTENMCLESTPAFLLPHYAIVPVQGQVPDLHVAEVC